MCLTLRYESHKPHNNSKFRWKVVRRYPDGRLVAPYKGTFYMEAGRWNTSDTEYKHGDLRQCGFHVFITRAAARRLATQLNSEIMRFRSSVAKVKVRGFLASGGFRGERSETWKQMQILK